MNKITFLFAATTCFLALSMVGCGDGGDNTVIEAPPAEESGDAMPGMSDEDYNDAMDADMQ